MIRISSLLVILLFVFSSMQAQISVGPLEQVRLKAGKFKQENLDRFKSQPTVFFLREGDDAQRFEKELGEVWDVTEIQFMPYSKINEVDPRTHNMFSLGGFETFVTSGSGMQYSNSHFYLHLWTRDEGEDYRGNPNKLTFARIDFHPTYADYKYITENDKDVALEYLYNKANLKNWKLGILKTYLNYVNDRLKSGDEKWLFETFAVEKEIRKLARKTLYIVDYVMVDFKSRTGDESGRHDENKLFEDYPYKYELMSSDALSEKILSSEDPFYFLVYLKSSTDVYLTVFNSETGEMVYSDYNGAKYNAKSKNFKDLAKEIKKAAK